MPAKDFQEVIKLIHKQDSRYHPASYLFLRKALDHTLQKVRSNSPDREGSHVTGGELLEGIRDYALRQYGPMTRTLLEHWGITSTLDFGHMVFNLVEYGVFGKTESDELKDFAEVYDFEKAFDGPFQPQATTAEGENEGPQE